jgi:hypothetical protein
MEAKIVEETINNGLHTSDLVMIGTALFLGACALFVPLLAELIRRRAFRPNLKIDFFEGYPYCHLTTYQDGSLVYYFRFQVLNEGKSLAKSCEVVLDELWISDSSGNFVQDKNFSSMNLYWAGQQYTSINPGRKGLYVAIGHISHPNTQKTREKSQYYLYKENEDLKFFFDHPVKFFSQRDCILPGRAKLRFVIYSENASKCERYFEISWSGKWRDREQDMWNELVIK